MPFDPLSITGLAFGAASLAVQVFEGAKRSYDYFELASDMPNECKSYRLRLQIECSRLLDWGDIVGFTPETEGGDPDSALRMNGAIVMALLSEINELLKKMRKTSLKYTELALEDTVGENRKKELSRADIGDFNNLFVSSNLPAPDKYHKGLNHVLKIGKGVLTISKRPKQLRWAVTDNKKFEKDLARLQELTNYLHESAGDYKLDVLRQTTYETKLALIQLSTSVEDIRALLQATRWWYHTSDNTQPLSSSAIITGKDQYDISTHLLEYGIIKMEIDSALRSKQLNSPQVDLTRLEIKTPSKFTSLYNNRSIANLLHDKYHPSPLRTIKKQVWVEWKEYRLGKHGITGNVYEHVQRLSSLLNDQRRPDEFRAPLCLGYCQDKKNCRFGFVFEYPEEANGSDEPKTLLQLMIEPKATSPSLKRRVKLACALATSLLYLHAVNWLHKDLSSSSVLFFSADENNILESPYISGFEASRPDEDVTGPRPSGTLGWELYCHPDYLEDSPRPMFRKAYDIYSLGIVLLEIAWWQPVWKLFNIDNPSCPDTSEVERIRTKLLSGGKEGFLEYVRTTMGDRYYNATRACIGGFKDGGKEDRKDMVSSAVLQQTYLRSVVYELKGISV